MTTTTTPTVFRRPSDAATTNLRGFHAPPLRFPSALDVSRDLDAVRRRRKLLSQRLGAVWLRGHVRD